jgi:DNA-binding IscR family transcriptional regulator
MTIEVTRGQYEYAAALSGGAMTTRDLNLEFGVTNSQVSRMMEKLRDAGVVRSSRKNGVHGNVRQHELIVDLETINIRDQRHVNEYHPITDEEIKYVAELREDSLVGQRLTSKFRERFPDRTHTTILNTMVPKARKRGLCL